MGKRTSIYRVGQETKDNILQTCRQLFYEKGYTKTSYNDICKTANINRGVIHYHFKTKRKIAASVDLALVDEFYDFALPFVKKEPSTIQTGCFIYYSIMNTLTNSHVYHFCIPYQSEHDETSIEDSFLFQKRILEPMLQTVLKNISPEKLKQRCCFWKGMQWYLLAAYLHGLLLISKEDLCMNILRYFYGFWDIPYDEINLLTSRVEVLCQTHPIGISQNFTFTAKANFQEDDFMKQHIENARKNFTSSYQKWSRKWKKDFTPTQQKIYDVCQKLFIEKGYIKTTYKDIAKELQMSEGVIPYHFGSKLDIAYHIYHSCLHQREDVINSILKNYTKAEISPIQQTFCPLILHIAQTGTYRDMLFGMMEEHNHLQYHIFEIEQNALKIDALVPEHKQDRRVMISCIHGIRNELLCQTYFNFYSGPDEAMDLILADELLHKAEHPNEHIILYLNILEQTKQYLNDWIFYMEDFTLKFTKKVPDLL